MAQQVGKEESLSDYLTRLMKARVWVRINIEGEYDVVGQIIEVDEFCNIIVMDEAGETFEGNAGFPPGAGRTGLTEVIERL